MIDRQKILAVIPARGGSKGIPYKNIKPLLDKPLLAWTILEAKKSKYIDRLILSSDDEKIIAVAQEYGCEVPFIRPSHLALDSTPGIDPVLHAIENLPGYDYVLLLQPTSPLRTVADIDGCIEQALRTGAPSTVGVSVSPKSPYWMYQVSDNNRMSPLLRNSFSTRQEHPQTYAINGALYLAKTSWLKTVKNFMSEETQAYIMPQDRSLDIDSETDFVIAEALAEKPIDL